METNWKKTTAIFLSSQSLSLFGTSLVQYAMSWYITLETQSGTMMTISLICGFLPMFLVSPFAGVWADRYNRKKLIMASDALSALVTLGVAIAFLSGHKDIYLIFIVMAIRGFGQGVQTPAIGAILPQFVPSDKLMRINALSGTIQSAIMLLSPVLAAALMAIIPMHFIFFIDVVTAFVAITLLGFFLRIGKQVRREEHDAKGYFHDLKTGLSYIGRHEFLGKLFIFCTIFFLMIGPVSALSPLQVTRLFGPDAWRLAVVEVTFSVGMLAGGVIMMSWGGFKNRHTTITSGIFVFSLFTLLLGLLPFFWFYIVAMILCGFSMPIFNTPFTVLLQEKIDQDYLGRVFGLFTMLTSISIPISLIVFGPLSDIISLNYIFIGTGLVMIIATIFMAKNKTLQKAGLPSEIQSSQSQE